MESTESMASDVESDTQRLVEMLDALSAELAGAGNDAEADTDEVGGGSTAAQENQAIRRTRSALSRARAESLGARVDEARRQARRVAEANAERKTRQRAAPGTTTAGQVVGDTQALRATMAESARRLNRTRTESQNPDEMLAAVVANVIHAIPHADGASITLLDYDGAITTHAPSDELVAQVELVQTELREGPCIDALDHAGTGITSAPDLSDSPPWPAFAAEAIGVGYHAVLSFQLYAHGSAGALNLYTTAANTFDHQDELVAALFADQAAVALAGARRVSELNKALETRDVIGRAKGILMERFSLDDTRAFKMLVESSQHTNMKLVAVAEWLVGQTEAANVRPAVSEQAE